MQRPVVPNHHGRNRRGRQSCSAGGSFDQAESVDDQQTMVRLTNREAGALARVAGSTPSAGALPHDTLRPSNVVDPRVTRHRAMLRVLVAVAAETHRGIFGADRRNSAGPSGRRRQAPESVSIF